MSLQSIPFSMHQVNEEVTYTNLGHFNEPTAPVLLHVQVEPLRLDLQHFRRQLLLLWLLTCTHQLHHDKTSLIILDPHQVLIKWKAEDLIVTRA